MPRSPRCRPAAGGFTLLEVILALAILGAALAFLTEGVRNAQRFAQRAALATQAEILARGLMGDLASGSIPLDPATGVSFGADSGWVYDVETAAVDVDGLVEGLLAVTVIVRQDLPDAARPVRYRLVRWAPEVLPTVDSTTQSASTSSASGSSSSASGSSTSGGAAR